MFYCQRKLYCLTIMHSYTFCQTFAQLFTSWQYIVSVKFSISRVYKYGCKLLDRNCSQINFVFCTIVYYLFKSLNKHALIAISINGH